MCRVFALTAGEERVTLAHWALDIPDSIVAQSHFEPDGTGLGFFDEVGNPVVEREPIPAFRDHQFKKEARTERSSTFIAHIRYASVESFETDDTHPFSQQGRLFAHNGIIHDLPALEREVGDDFMRFVDGHTDSERMFALISKRITERDDITEGLTDAMRWVADNIPVYSLNLVLATHDELWALRYPQTHALHVLERRPRGESNSGFRGASANNAMRVHSDDLDDKPTVIVASEPMDDDPGWREIANGELLHISPEVVAHSDVILDRPPKTQLAIDDLNPRAADSQRHPNRKVA
jgi:glutamine amidotransferase